METDYFAGCQNDEQRKIKFRELAKKHHPDKGGDIKIMQEINAQYSNKSRATQQRAGHAKPNASNDYADAFRYTFNQRNYNFGGFSYDTFFSQFQRMAEEVQRQKDEAIKNFHTAQQEAYKKAKYEHDNKMPKLERHDVITVINVGDDIFVTNIWATNFTGKNIEARDVTFNFNQIETIYRNGEYIWKKA